MMNVPAFVHHASDERILDLERHLVQISARRTRGADHQLAALFVDEHDRAHRRIERLRHHLGDHLQNSSR